MDTQGRSKRKQGTQKSKGLRSLDRTASGNSPEDSQALGSTVELQEISGKDEKIKYLPIFIALFAAVALCIIFGVRYNRLARAYTELLASSQSVGVGETEGQLAGAGRAEQEANDGTNGNGITGDTNPIDGEGGTSGTGNAGGTENGTKGGTVAEDAIRRVYLTFDDGPSRNTDNILDILDTYQVKATFFVCGKSGFDDEYNRIVEEGHTLAMHSYSHDYSEIYESLDSFQTDLHRLQNYLYDMTGVWCKLYRFPGGSSNTASKVDMQELTDYLDREGIVYYDWNIYGGDNIDATTMAENVADNLPDYSEAIILMHDASDKNATVEALPQIIEMVQAMDNTEIVPITEDTVPVQHK